MNTNDMKETQNERSVFTPCEINDNRLKSIAGGSGSQCPYGLSRMDTATCKKCGKHVAGKMNGRVCSNGVSGIITI